MLAALREKIEKLAPPCSQRSSYWKATAVLRLCKWCLQDSLFVIAHHPTLRSFTSTQGTM